MATARFCTIQRNFFAHYKNSLVKTFLFIFFFCSFSLFLDHIHSAYRETLFSSWRVSSSPFSGWGCKTKKTYGCDEEGKLSKKNCQENSSLTKFQDYFRSTYIFKSKKKNKHRSGFSFAFPFLRHFLEKSSNLVKYSISFYHNCYGGGTQFYQLFPLFNVHKCKKLSTFHLASYW